MLFRNMARKYYSAANGEGGEGGGQGGGEQQQQQHQTQQPPAIDYDKLAAAMVKAQKGADQQQQQEESAFDRIKREQQAKDKTTNDEARIRSDVAFDLSFNKLVDDNAAAFGLSSEAIRKGVGSGLDGSKQVEQLKVTAAKAFLSIEANLALLSPADKAYYESAIKGRHDAAVDADKAWQVVERTLHIKGQLDYQNKVRGGGASDQNKGKLPLMDAYFKRCIDRCRPKTRV